MAYDYPASEDARIDVAALFGAIIRKLPRILLVTLALLAATFVVLMFQPRLYQSAASILVEPRENAYARASGEQAPMLYASNAAGVVSSQIELIKARDTLLEVVDELDLRSVAEFNGSQSGASPIAMLMQLAGRRPTPTSVDETVVSTLYERLSVAQARDSAIISVAVMSQDPELAAELANAVARTHVSRRAALSVSDTAETSEWLLAEIERLRASVRQAEAAVADFRVDNDLFVVGQGTLLDQQLTTIAGQITAAQERKNAAISRAALIRGLIDRGQSIEGVADGQVSAVIQQLSQERTRVQGELAQRSATLLANHPTIRSLNAQVSELDARIRQEGQRVAASLDAEAQVQADLEASLQAELARAKASASTATRDTVTLDSLEREAKAQRDLLEAYLLRYNEASSRVDVNSALPDVRVVSMAAPSVTPASPKTSLFMIAVGLVSVAVQIGAVAFSELMSGRALRPIGRPVAPVRQDELDAMPFDEAELEPDQTWEVEEPQPEVQVEEVTAEVPEVVFEPQFETAPEPVAVAVVPAEPDVEATRDFIRSLMQPKDEAIRAFADDVDTFAGDADIEQPAAASAAPARATPHLLRYADLVSDLVLGRTHLLLLADHGDDLASRAFAEDLCGDALSKGLSVALIDAGTGHRSESPGITDLSNGTASFGDVVQKSADNSFAEVTWGQGASLDHTSTRPVTLAEALGDIYEVVVVLTGAVGPASSLAAFAELGGRVVLVAGDERDADMAEITRQNLEASGLPRVEIAALAEPVAA